MTLPIKGNFQKSITQPQSTPGKDFDNITINRNFIYEQI